MQIIMHAIIMLMYMHVACCNHACGHKVALFAVPPTASDINSTVERGHSLTLHPVQLGNLTKHLLSFRITVYIHKDCNTSLVQREIDDHYYPGNSSTLPGAGGQVNFSLADFSLTYQPKQSETMTCISVVLSLSNFNLTGNNSIGLEHLNIMSRSKIVIGEFELKESCM